MTIKDTVNSLKEAENAFQMVSFRNREIIDDCLLEVFDFFKKLAIQFKGYGNSIEVCVPFLTNHGEDDFYIRFSPWEDDDDKLLVGRWARDNGEKMQVFYSFNPTFEFKEYGGKGNSPLVPTVLKDEIEKYLKETKTPYDEKTLIDYCNKNGDKNLGEFYIPTMDFVTLQLIKNRDLIYDLIVSKFESDIRKRINFEDELTQIVKDL